MRLLLLTVAALAASTTLGCEARVSLGGRCDDAAECTAPLVCRFGRCRAECATASDCDDPSAICIGAAGRGVCTVPTLDTCASDCGDELVCGGEVCSVACVPGGSDCLPGSSCGASGVCEASPDASTGTLLCNGFELVCAVSGGRVYCWGNDHNDQLGDGEDDHGARCPFVSMDYDCASAPSSPVLDAASGTALESVVSIGCGEAFACALTSGGRVACWGQPGPHIGAVAPAAPQALEAIPSGATELTVGYAHACARLADGGHVCWGLNGEGGAIDGRLGRPEGMAQETPADAPGFDGLRLLSAGRFATCGVAGDGAVTCAGERDAFGVADPAGRTIAGASAVTALTTGLAHACALAAEGLVCWGTNASGQLGTGAGGPDCPDRSCRLAAAPVDGSAGVSLRSLSHGASEHTCAIDADGQVRCWGYQPCGDAGVDPMDGSRDSVRVLGPPVVRTDGAPLTGVVEVAVGGSTCARTSAGEIWCWGNNNYGQLGFFETSAPPAFCLSTPYATAHPIALP